MYIVVFLLSCIHFVSSCFYTNIATVYTHLYIILQINESKGYFLLGVEGEIGGDRYGC